MNILAIDPGPIKSAYVIWDGEKVLDYGLMDNTSLSEKIIYNDFDVEYDKTVIEMIASYGMSVGAEVFDTCVWIGKFIELIMIYRSCEHPSYMYRKDVKSHICGSVKAKDSNIRQALIDRFGPQGTKRNPGPLFGITKDKLAALAVAVTYYDTKKILL